MSSLYERLRRVQRLLAAHDEHHPDCDCAFCEARGEVDACLFDLRLREKAA